MMPDPRPVLTLHPSRPLWRALAAEATRRRMRVERFVLEAAEVRLSEGRTRQRTGAGAAYVYPATTRAETPGPARRP